MKHKIVLFFLISTTCEVACAEPQVPMSCVNLQDPMERVTCYDTWARLQIGSEEINDSATNATAKPAQAKVETASRVRLFVKTNIEPVKPADEAKLKDLPASLSISRRDGEHFVDARAAALAQFRLGDFEETSGFAGVQWTRSETPDKRSDARTIGFGMLHYIQAQSDPSTWWATLEPKVSYTTDIAKDEDTVSVKLSTDFGHFRYSEGETIEPYNISKVPFWFTLAVIGRHVNAETGPDRDFALAQLTANIGWQPHARLYFRARPSVVHYLDAPAGFDEGNLFGIVAAEWDLSSGPDARWKPSLLLSRSFGENSSDPDYIANLTKLSFSVRFDSAPPGK